MHFDVTSDVFKCLYKFTLFVVNKILTFYLIFELSENTSEINLIMQILRITSPKIYLFLCLSNILIKCQ